LKPVVWPDMCGRPPGSRCWLEAPWTRGARPKVVRAERMRPWAYEKPD